MEGLRKKFNATLVTHKFLKRHLYEYIELFNSIGAESFIPEHFVPNHNMVKANVEYQNVEGIKEYVMQEIGITSFGLLLVIAWHQKDRTIVHATHARMVLDVVCHTFFEPTFDLGSLVQQYTIACQTACTEDPVSEDGNCFCFTRALNILSGHGIDTDTEGPSPIVDIIASFIEFMDLAMVCPATISFFRLLLTSVADVIDASLLDGNLEIDLLAECEGRKKRKRISESFKYAVVRTAVEGKRARNPEALLRALNFTCDSVSRQWVEEEMLTTVATSKRAISGLTWKRFVLGMVSDGARLGDPPEETVAFAMWTPQLDAGTVGVPQVLKRSTQTGRCIPHFRPER